MSLTDAERAAVADHERPGVWLETAAADDRDPVDFGGDGRAFSQHETDALIAFELHERSDAAARAELVAAVGPILPVRLVDAAFATASQQRGGLHSDPLLRLLAYRAWGDRDRAWRKRDSARPFLGDDIDAACVERVYGFDEIDLVPILAHGKHRSIRLHARRGGQRAHVEVPDTGVREVAVLREALLDMLDELDRRLE